MMSKFRRNYAIQKVGRGGVKAGDCEDQERGMVLGLVIDYDSRTLKPSV
jgi:hypothetical protein